MPDDKSIVAPQDRERVDVNDLQEVRNWTRSLGVTPEELIAARERAGSTYIDDIKKELDKN